MQWENETELGTSVRRVHWLRQLPHLLSAVMEQMLLCVTQLLPAYPFCHIPSFLASFLSPSKNRFPFTCSTSQKFGHVFLFNDKLIHFTSTFSHQRSSVIFTQLAVALDPSFIG